LNSTTRSNRRSARRHPQSEIANRFSDAGEETVLLFQKAPGLKEIVPLAAGIYEPQEWFEDAANLYTRLLEIAPARQDIRFQLAKAHFRMERRDIAEGLFKQILSDEPTHEGARYFLGLLAAFKKKWSAAIDSFQTVIRAKGSYFSLAIYQLHFIVRILVDEGDLDGALAQLEFILAHDPVNTDVLADKALVNSMAGRIEAADKAYERLLELEPWNSSYVNDYALHLLGSGRTEEAMAAFDKSIKIDGNIDSLENMGSHYFFTMKDDERALPFFERVLQAAPMRTKSLVLAEWIRAKLGKASGNN